MGVCIRGEHTGDTTVMRGRTHHRCRVAAILAFATGLSIPLSVLAVPARAPVISFHYDSVLQQARGDGPDGVDFVLIDGDPTVYRAQGVRTIPLPAAVVAEAALDFRAYPRMFEHVFRCDSVSGPRGLVSARGTWYVEGRAPPARVWAIGNIDGISWSPDSTELRLFASQNEHRWLEKRWRVVLPRWVNLRTHGLRLAAAVVARGEDSCRVAIVAQAWTTKPMPAWLCELAVRLVLPRLFDDLAAEAKRRRPEPEKPWWRFW